MWVLVVTVISTMSFHSQVYMNKVTEEPFRSKDDCELSLRAASTAVPKPGDEVRIECVLWYGVMDYSAYDQAKDDDDKKPDLPLIRD